MSLSELIFIPSYPAYERNFVVKIPAVDMLEYLNSLSWCLLIFILIKNKIFFERKIIYKLVKTEVP